MAYWAQPGRKSSFQTGQWTKGISVHARPRKAGRMRREDSQLARYFFLRTLLEVKKHRDNDGNWDLSKRCSNLEAGSSHALTVEAKFWLIRIGFVRSAITVSMPACWLSIIYKLHLFSIVYLSICQSVCLCIYIHVMMEVWCGNQSDLRELAISSYESHGSP